MYNENVKRAVFLQLKANTQIDQFGQANNETINELMELVDNFDEGEESDFVELYNIEKENLPIFPNDDIF